ncbi:MAG: GNAT family N-acetyltransferase [Pikeienuella sp.]
MTTRYLPGDEIEYTITYLEMASRPSFALVPIPAQKGLALVRAENPPVRWFLHLYDSVGADHEWMDWHDAPAEELRAFVQDENVTMYTLMLQGWTAGFFVLDHRQTGVVDLAYFGLTPEARGRGLSGWLLTTAIQTGWSQPDVACMTLNTCTLDGPRALPMYQKYGFSPVRQETKTRILTGPWPRGE